MLTACHQHALAFLVHDANKRMQPAFPARLHDTYRDCGGYCMTMRSGNPVTADACAHTIAVCSEASVLARLAPGRPPCRPDAAEHTPCLVGCREQPLGKAGSVRPLPAKTPACHLLQVCIPMRGAAGMNPDETPATAVTGGGGGQERTHSAATPPGPAPISSSCRPTACVKEHDRGSQDRASGRHRGRSTSHKHLASQRRTCMVQVCAQAALRHAEEVPMSRHLSE